MPKVPSKDLYLLIKSLHKSEKGYVKKSAFRFTSGEEKKFIKLFDAIDHQDEYNESNLRIDKEEINQLPRLKNYLYDRILSSLEQFHEGRNIEPQLRHQLNKVQVLFDKGLYTQCKKQLEKAKEIAIKFEKITQLLDILEWERVLIIEELMTEDLFEIARQEADAIEKLINLEFYKTAYDKISALYAKTLVIRTRDEDNEFQKIINDKKFESEKEAFTVTAKILYYKTVGKYLSALGDKKNYLLYAKNAIELMESQPDYINQNIPQYIKVLNNLCVSLSENNMIIEWNKAIEKLKSIPSKYPAADNDKYRALIFIRLIVREFYHNQHIKNFAGSYLLINKIEKGLEKYNKLLSSPHKIMFYYAIAYTYFVDGKFKNALEWCNKILRHPKRIETQAINNYAKILNIIIHYELKNTELLEYTIRSLKRSLGLQQKLYHLENKFILFMERIIRIDVFKLEQIEFQRFKDYLINMNDPLEHNISEYFDFYAWIDSKLKGISLKEALSKSK